MFLRTRKQYLNGKRDITVLATGSLNPLRLYNLLLHDRAFPTTPTDSPLSPRPVVILSENDEFLPSERRDPSLADRLKLEKRSFLLIYYIHYASNW